jgi:hypothetical protein
MPHRRVRPIKERADIVSGTRSSLQSLDKIFQLHEVIAGTAICRRDMSAPSHVVQGMPEVELDR